MHSASQAAVRCVTKHPTREWMNFMCLPFIVAVLLNSSRLARVQLTRFQRPMQQSWETRSRECGCYMVRKSPTPARNSRGRRQFDSGTRESWRRATRQVTRQPGVTIYSVPHPQFQRREKKRGAWTLQQKGCEGLCFPFTPQVCRGEGKFVQPLPSHSIPGNVL